MVLTSKRSAGTITEKYTQKLSMLICSLLSGKSLTVEPPVHPDVSARVCLRSGLSSRVIIILIMERAAQIKKAG